MGGWRFAGIFFVSLLGGSLGALILSPEDLTVGASGAVFGLMAAGFIEARDRGLNDVASQIGFYVSSTWSSPSACRTSRSAATSAACVAGGVLTLLLAQARRSGGAGARSVEMGIILGSGAALVSRLRDRRQRGRAPGALDPAGTPGRRAAPPTRSGWRRCARSSTPSTRRGPGRENEEAASTAQISLAPRLASSSAWSRACAAASSA